MSKAGAAAAVAWGKGLKVQMVRLERVRPNPWNPNVMTADMFEKERRSIRDYGFIEPIKVRELTATPEDPFDFEIIDGEHRSRAAPLEGITEVPAVNLGQMDDARAKRLTIIANELRGAPEPVKLAALVKDLTASSTIDELAEVLPMTAVELDALAKMGTTFDWGQVEAALPDVQVRPVTANAGEHRRFQIGTVKCDIPAKLHDELMAEFERSRRASGGAGPEVVLRDWLERLKATAAQVDAAAAALPPPPPAPPKRRAKAAK